MVVCTFAVASVAIGRLVPTVLELDALQAHRSCTVTPECQDSAVPVVVPGFERLVFLRTARLAASLALLRTARLVASLARHAATAVAAIGVY